MYLKIGQKIRIKKCKLDRQNESYDRIFWNNYDMNKYNGKLATIKEIKRSTSGIYDPKYKFIYKLNVDNGHCVWSIDWLQPLRQKVYKYGVGTPFDFTTCNSHEKLKDLMSINLGQIDAKNIIGYKLVPILKIKKNGDDIKFAKN